MKTTLLFSLFIVIALTIGSNTTWAADSKPAHHPNPELFLQGALSGPATSEPCTLSNGTETNCYRLTIVGAPANADFTDGPYCPPSIDSTKKEGGMWIDGKGTVFEVDGEFIKNLAELYNDDRWQMYDSETGEITVFKGAEGCSIAGDPKNAPPTDNFCLECTLDEMNGGIKRTILIPSEPVPLDTPAPINRRKNIGVALNGVLFGPPAPIEFILGTYTLGLFDDCGGHGNPHEGYHYHAATSCSEIIKQEDGHASQIGYALDGYPIFAELDAAGNASDTLDQCGGESDPVRGYHYHASSPDDNQIIACYTGEQGCMSEDPDAECDASTTNSSEGQSNGPGGGRPDIAAAAKKLGVSEDELKQALGAPPPNFEKAADKLGISAEQLQKALSR